jgi:hypothetical protein
MFKFGYEFYVIRGKNAIPKQENSCRNIIMKTAIIINACISSYGAGEGIASSQKAIRI